MKVNVEIECTPEEARQFLGLPDISKAQSAYGEAMAKAMKGAANTEQLQEFARQMAPVGQIGLKLFQQFMDSAGGTSNGRDAQK